MAPPPGLPQPCFAKAAWCAQRRWRSSHRGNAILSHGTENSMNLPALLGDFFWKPKGFCPSLQTWHSQDPQKLPASLVSRYVAVDPEPGCRCYVAELVDGKVIGNAKLVSTARDIALGDIQFLYGDLEPERHWILTQRRFRVPQRLAGTAVVLAASNAENYYHWLFDSLPRLYLLALAGYHLDDIDFLLLDDSKKAFQLQGLAHLGIPQAKLRHCSRRRVAECSRLIVPSMPGPLGRPPRWLCSFLRRKFIGTRTVLPYRKIYVSRQHARGRRIVNESQIVSALVDHGYEIVYAERLAFLEQVELFASAKEVISIHGAGMSNIVFAPRNAKILELGSPLHSNGSFRTLAANCDLRYEHMYLAAAEEAGRADSRFANIVVEPASFRRKLEDFSERA